MGLVIGKKQKKRGFSIVELMIVFTVMGILAAISIPKAQRARARAQKTHCIENLRQLTGTIQTYLLEHRTETIPDLNGLGDYFQKEVLCPSGGEYSVDPNQTVICTLAASDEHAIGL